jgi:hypothetical protein
MPEYRIHDELISFKCAVKIEISRSKCYRQSVILARKASCTLVREILRHEMIQNSDEQIGRGVDDVCLQDCVCRIDRGTTAT